MLKRTLPVVLAACALPLNNAWAQSVVVDQGTFEVSLHGTAIGSEDFSIRRAGFRLEAMFIATGVIALEVDGAAQELRPLLSATSPDGATGGYEMTVTGVDQAEITLNLVGRRFLSSYVSPAGEEEREFRARPDTRVVERFVAHHYYFLRNVREGAEAAIIQPRSRAEATLTAGPWVEEELVLGGTQVSARRVSFGDGDDVRTVWFDRQGRVLRVEIPADGYVAERRDLVG